MTSIRALIVDDEPLARRGIRQLLEPYPDVTVVGECRDGREAARALSTERPDLVFLDVEMPGLDGLTLIRVRGAEAMPLIVFVTAH
jgi:two-component system, LytTR family, response regulator